MAQMSPQMENQLMQFQQVQQQLQIVATQRVQLEAQTKELERAIETLNNSKPDTPVYKSVGSILVRAENKDSVKKELEEQKETISVRVKTLERQESHLRERYQSLQQQIANALNPKISTQKERHGTEKESKKNEKEDD